MNNILYILIFSTLLFSCSDSEKLSPVETVEKSETKLDTEKLGSSRDRRQMGVYQRSR